MKIKEFPSSFPTLSPSRLIESRGTGWDGVAYSVIFVFFNLSGLKVKVGGLRVKFVKICELVDECDILEIIFKS